MDAEVSLPHFTSLEGSMEQRPALIGIKAGIFCCKHPD